MNEWFIHKEGNVHEFCDTCLLTSHLNCSMPSCSRCYLIDEHFLAALIVAQVL